ncbi:MAG: M20/M25/M40 family metallo-hydrolase [Chloroflexi bacterium]|nr:M20/M25/M40 family metallo-hydrolase [Chloroflexota bacterium]
MITERTDQLDAHLHRQEVVDLMRGLQAFRSFPPHEGPCMVYLADWLRARGLAVDLLDVHDEPGRPDLVCAVRGAGGGRSLMFNGHLDIDPVPLNYLGDPWDCREVDGRLYGHGLGNMKAGIAAMAAATVAVVRAGVPLRGDLLFTAVVGELQGGVGAVELVRRGILGDCAVVGEPSDDLRIVTQHAGAVQMLIHVTGESAWIGALHQVKAVNAVEKMARVVQALQGITFSVPPRPEFPSLPRLLVGGINGGVGRDYGHWRASYVPDFCTIIVEVRGLPGQDWERTRDEVEAVLKRLAAEDPELRYQIEMPPATYGPHWASMKVAAHGIDVPRTHYLPQAVARHHRAVTGEEPRWHSYNAWNDSGHYTRAGCTSLNYGPSSERDERGDYVVIERVLQAARVHARVAAEVCTTPK